MKLIEKEISRSELKKIMREAIYRCVNKNLKKGFIYER